MGTRDSLRRAISRFLKPLRRRHAVLRRICRDARFAALVAGALLASATPQNAPAIELSDIAAGTGGFVINGIDMRDASGFSVSSVGDINGDGLADVIVGTPGGDPGDVSGAGESYIVFGKADGTAVDLSEVAAGVGGFAINGIDLGDGSGFSVSGAGDVNGDGLPDFIIGAYRADLGGGSFTGESYVVFGKTDETAVELSAVAAGMGGFVMNGIDPNDRSGRAVSSAGDVNGDGLADVIIGASTADPGGRGYAGESYVIFGKADGTAVELSAVAGGAGGFLIKGRNANDASGWSVSGAGDVNGDGQADLIVGAPGAGPDDKNRAGESYVVFGKADGNAVELSAVAAGSGGFVMNGSHRGDTSGWAVSSAGDANGDGLADLIIGAILASPGGGSWRGATYIVFGKGDGAAVELSAVEGGSGGFVINGIDDSDTSGQSVSGAGDVNGDGLADAIVGARWADPGGRDLAGESYVVFGKADGTAVDLSAVAGGSGGFILNGIDADDLSGVSVSSAGDVNGDGLADLIVGASSAAPGERERAGESYVVFSPEAPAASATYRMVTLAGDGPGGMVAPVTDFGDVARVKIDFSDEDLGAGGGLNGASQEVVTITRSGAGISGLADASDVLWEITSDRTGFDSAEITLKYLDSEVPDLPFGEGGLAIFRAPAPSGPWMALPTAIDAARNEAKTTVDEFGFFALAARPGNAAALWEIYE